tara:strand:- start:1271 stop:2383 length:1113 start_codon:yes stop_codon:yes gene_type:complete
MKNTKIIVKTISKSYPIYFGNKILNSVGKIVENHLPKVNKICIISDRNVPAAFQKKIKKSLKKYNLKIYRIAANEKVKNIKVAYKLIEDLLKNNFNRSDCIISLGGGVLGDLTALVSSLVKRGVKFVNIPTTLLAQVDASIGGKTAINTKQGKNLIGTFYQPEFVLIDTDFLKSLPRREMLCGYGEILKHSLISDKKFFLWLNRNAKKIIDVEDKNILKKAILQSCKIKSKIVNRDEKENNLRMILNFGHTFAHGFEGAKNFSKKLNHGEAVLLGMMAACHLSYNKKLIGQKDLSLIKNHYRKFGLPMKISKFFKKKEIPKIISFMKKDKKNTNERINLILIKNIGRITDPNRFSSTDKEIKKFMMSYYD